ATEDPRPRLLAGGEITTKRPPPAMAETRTIAGATRGDLAFRVESSRRILAAPFAEQMHVHVSLEGDVPIASPVDLTLSGAAIDVSSPTLTTDAHGDASFDVTAHAHNVELSIAARAVDHRGVWEGTLPVVAGAIWLAPSAAGGRLRLVSPAPKDRAYVS